MAQGSPRSFDKAYAGGGVGDLDGRFARGAGFEFVEPFAERLGDEGGFECSGYDAVHSGYAGGVTAGYPHAGQRSDLAYFAAIARCFDPGVRAGFSVLGVGARFAGRAVGGFVVPGVGRVFGDLGDVHIRGLAADMDARADQFVAAVVVKREDAVGEEVGRSFADLEVIAVGVGQETGILGVFLLHELGDFGQQLAVGVDLFLLGGHGGAAGYDGDLVGHFAAEQGDHFVALAADFQGLEVVADEPFVCFFVEAVVAGVVVGEGGDRRELDVVGQGEVVEVDYVGLEEVAAQDEVPDDAAVGRHLDAEGVVEGEGGGGRGWIQSRGTSCRLPRRRRLCLYRPLLLP